MNIRRSSSGKKSEIGLIPLINVIFLLLCFFIISGDFNQSPSMPVDLPQAKGAARATRESRIVINKNNEVILKHDKNDVVIKDMNELEREFIKSSAPVIIAADKHSSAQRLVHILAILEKVGVRNTSILVTGG